MDIRYNKSKLSKILENIYELLKTPISIFDEHFGYITSYPPDGYMSDFCRRVRADKERHERCLSSDREACAACKDSGRVFSYTCHAGIRETVMPIRFERLIIGYIIFGQYVLDGVGGDVVGYAREHGMDERALARAHSLLTVLDERQVSATCKIIESCILQFWLSDAIVLKENELAKKIKSFIDENIAEPITANDICKSFFVSRQKLYTVFGESFRVSVKRYIIERRIELSKHLLGSTEYSVAAIAGRVGFSDYNNFIQRFKKETGLTPLQYRKAITER